MNRLQCKNFVIYGKKFVCQLEINDMKWQKLFELYSQLSVCGEIRVENLILTMFPMLFVFDFKDDRYSILSGVFFLFAISPFHMQIYARKAHGIIFRIIKNKNE